MKIANSWVYDCASQGKYRRFAKVMLDFGRRKRDVKTIPVLRLSAKMVELSLQHNQHTSPLADFPTRFPPKSEGYLKEPNIQPVSVTSTTQEEANKATQVDRKTEAYGGLVRTSRELFRRSISRISGHLGRIHDSRLWTSTGIVALALLVFGAVYGLRGSSPDSLKSHSQIAPASHQKALVPSTGTAAANTHNDSQTLAPNKSKSRRRQGDYVAKNTYVYYGKGGKPSH